MDKDKAKAVSEWPTSGMVKELQRFLNFANFYSRFIRGFRMVAASMTSLLKKGPKKLTWNDLA